MSESKKKISINFSRFWYTLDPFDNFFLKLLSPHFDIEVSDNPDYLLYSVFKPMFRFRPVLGDHVSIFYTGENVRPDMSRCHWAFGFDYEEDVNHPRYMRWPLYCDSVISKKLIKERPYALADNLHARKFCCFVFTNPVPFRESFFDTLCEYKKIDSPGKSKNNMPSIDTRYGHSRYQSKIAFQSEYKFTIAFENSSYPGYTTEKLVHAMLSNSLPIYWGNPEVVKDFNTKSFLCYHDFPDEESFIKRIIEVDQNDELYLEYLNQPWFHDNTPSIYIDNSRVIDRFKIIFTTPLSEINSFSLLTRLRTNFNLSFRQFSVKTIPYRKLFSFLR